MNYNRTKVVLTHLHRMLTANIIMTDNRVKETFSTELGVTIIVYSKGSTRMKTVLRSSTHGMATLIPSWYLVWYDTRRELISTEADVTIVDGGVAVSVTVTEDPVHTKTTVSKSAYLL